jgi:acetyl esterase/lipase
MTDIATIRNLVYGPDRSHRLDIYLPKEGNGAVLLALHGGGWVRGDKASMQRLATALARAGYLVAAPNYRLVKPHRRRNLFPVQALDCSRALSWLRSGPHATKNTPAGAIGIGSGGTLAVEMAIRHGMPGASWSGLLDLEGFVTSHPDLEARPASEASAARGRPDPRHSLWLVETLLGGNMNNLAKATPLNRVSDKTGPMFLANSTEELVPAMEVVLMAHVLATHGVAHRTLIMSGARHGHAYQSLALPGTLAFMEDYLL